MPWPKTKTADPKGMFVRAVWQRRESIAALCRQFGISRECGHKWLRRFAAQGRAGLVARSHASHHALHWRALWHERVLRLRRARPTWGPHKLRWLLRRTYRRRPLPSERTIARWLKAAHLTRRRVRWSRPGPVRSGPGRGSARRPNEVWTVDFKGCFRTGNGERVTALTVRDLVTKFVFCVRQVQPTEAAVRAQFTRLFRRHGLPRALRTDNGAPFGGRGALGLSRFSAWCLRLGVAVQFGRPRCPQDNAAHEQMHGVLKQETAQPPAPNPAAQQRRFDRWRHDYNHCRPHTSLADAFPATRYRPSRRRFPATLLPWRYPAAWPQVTPNAKGCAWWSGRSRMFGRAFYGYALGLKPVASGVVDVFFGPHFLGSLHQRDRAGLRPVRWRALSSGQGGSQAPSLKPSP